MKCDKFVIQGGSFNCVEAEYLPSHISKVTNDKRKTSFLFLQLSFALQKGNAACILGSIPIVADPIFD